MIGTKRSGLAAIELFRKHGARVRAMDSSPLTPEEQAGFAQMGVPVALQEPENIGAATLIVLSPAVPYDLPMLIAARARGLDTCAQAAWTHYHKVIRPVLGLAPEEVLVCGMALGVADPDAPEDALVTERVNSEQFMSWLGFDRAPGERT